MTVASSRSGARGAGDEYARRVAGLTDDRGGSTASPVREDVAVGTSTQATDSAEKGPKAPEGISQFITKVLDQLNLSSWLPAALLVGCGALLLQLHSQRNLNIGSAVIALTAKPLGILIVVLFALVLTAMVSQAFSFEVIRLLEGYWGGSKLTARFFRICVRIQSGRLAKLRARESRQQRRAFAVAREQMLATGIPRHVIDIREDEIYDRAPDDKYTEEQRAEATALNWRVFSSPEQLGQLDRILARISEFPRLHRIRPTKLGNVLRATEDTLPDDGDLEGFILRRGETIPSQLRMHHDQFRTRLEMYCTLVFVHTLLAILSAALLTRSSPWPIMTAIVTFFLLLGAVSYSAAITSARGYTSTLRAIAEHEQNSAVTEQTRIGPPNAV